MFTLTTSAGTVVPIPPAVEAEGGAAIDAYVASVTAPPAPAPPSTPAPEPPPED